LGHNAEKSGLVVGDRVGVPWINSTCHNCEFCISGWETLCPNQKQSGFSITGAMAEFALASANSVVKIPSNVSFTEAAPILCAGVTGYKAIKETEARPGEFISIFGGAGGLGHLAIQYAKAMGLRVIALDVGQKNLDYCKKLGAEFAVDATHADAEKLVLDYTGGGSHGVVVLPPNPSAFKLGVNITRARGTVTFVGLPPGPFECPIIDVVLKRVTMRGSIVGSRKDLQEALDFSSRGLVKCNIETAPLDDVDKIIDRLRHGKVQGRVVIEM